MAIAKKEGRDGIDRWTSNGYGLSVEPPKKEKKEKEENERVNKKVREFVTGS